MVESKIFWKISKCHLLPSFYLLALCFVTFRDECENIRQTLLVQQREENDAAVNHVLALKEKELDAYKKELQQQISRYQQQVSS